MSLEKVSGESLAKRMEGKEPMVLPLNDPRVQVILAKAAFPGVMNPLDPWLEEKGGKGSLSSRFRAYIEDRTSAITNSIDIHDASAIAALLSAVKSHDPETMH